MEASQEPPPSGMTRSTSNYLMLNATPSTTPRIGTDQTSETSSLSADGFQDATTATVIAAQADATSQLPLICLLPYRGAYYALPLLALTDLASALTLAVFTAQLHPKGVELLLIWHFVRPCILVQSGLSWRIREKGFITLLTSMASLLLVLWYINVLVQRFRTYPSASHRILPALILSHLCFAIAHWLLFVALIGVRRDVNPFGLGSLVVTRNDFVAPTTRGLLWDEDETEPPSRLLCSEDLAFDSDDQSGEGSEVDPDDIIDMPKSTSVRSSMASYLNGPEAGRTVRQRTSQATLRPDV